jgi:prepilin-type N-terminal cleavage/methylation domain-containing protein
VNARGFTLLEAMVTLVIIALVATLLMQSLVHVLGMRERVLHHERDARVVALHERWFRDTIAAAAADHPGEVPAFRGDAGAMEFLSLDALRSGSAARVGWRLVDAERGVQLVYAEGGADWRLASGGLEGAAFAYLDAAGRWHDAWPLPEQPAEILPRAVRLAWRTSGGERWWWAQVGAAPGLPPILANRLEQVDAAF